MVNINLSSDEMKLLLKHLAIANNVFWVLDADNWDKYWEILDKSDELIDKVLQSCTDWDIKVENWELLWFSEDFFDENLEELDDFEDYTFWDNLAYEFAKKEVEDENSEEFDKSYELYLKEIKNNSFKYVKYFWGHK